MKTAIEQLQEMVESKLTMPMGLSFKELFEQAKAIEKQKIIDAYQEGFNNAYFNNPLSKEQYYNETFKI
jgi:hypothetical protein